MFLHYLLCRCVVPAGYPRIVNNPTLKAVDKGRNTVMLCSATGDPEPTISWLKDYLPIDLTDRRYTVLPTGKYSQQLVAYFFIQRTLTLSLSILQIICPQCFHSHFEIPANPRCTVLSKPSPWVQGISLQQCYSPAGYLQRIETIQTEYSLLAHNSQC